MIYSLIFFLYFRIFPRDFFLLAFYEYFLIVSFSYAFQSYSQEQLLDMSIDLLSFVDSRVTLPEHPLNELIRNAIQLKFSEPKDELKLHIGREGIHYRLVSTTKKK